VITGPSGVGKSTIVRRVRELCDAGYGVSATTRAPRDGERDKEDYFFIDDDTFKRMVDAGDMLEWAEVFGCFYGTPADQVRDAVGRGEKIILDIDVQGGIQVAEKIPNARFILIVPPDMETLRERLTKRGSETTEQLERRLSQAQRELRIARESGVYKIEIINDDLEDAIRGVVDEINQE